MSTTCPNSGINSDGFLYDHMEAQSWIVWKHSRRRESHQKDFVEPHQFLLDKLAEMKLGGLRRILSQKKNKILMEAIPSINFDANKLSNIISLDGLSQEKTNVYSYPYVKGSNPIQTYSKKYPPITQPPNAAVMLLIYEKNEELHILFIERASKGKHPGEIALPGGKVEANELIEACVMRETFEEVNLSSRENSLQILNSLPPCITYTTKVLVQVIESIHLI
jgi:NADH pyrophosphatase NudC (nudix superfamily)